MYASGAGLGASKGKDITKVAGLDYAALSKESVSDECRLARGPKADNLDVYYRPENDMNNESFILDSSIVSIGLLYIFYSHTTEVRKRVFYR
jgi:hypothetical protein